MEITRKRPSEEKPLTAPKELRMRLEPSDPSGFSASASISGPDHYDPFKTEQETISNGESEKSDKTISDSIWGSGNYRSMRGSTSVSSESLDQSPVCKKSDDDPEENLVEADSWNEQNRRKSLRTLKDEIGAHEDRAKASQSTEQTRNQPSKLHTCVCGKSYSRRSHLHRHQKTHVCSGLPAQEPPEIKASSENSFPCVCGKIYNIKFNLYRHKKTCQAGAMTSVDFKEENQLKPHVCACGKRYTSRSHLYRHQRSHLDGSEDKAKSYICDCGRLFSSSSHLSQHQKTHTQENLQIEERGGDSVVEHGDDSVVDTEAEAVEMMKPYVCPCGKSYTSRSHLYRHQKTHKEGDISESTRSPSDQSTMEKPYKCECGKSYTSTSHLYRHQRSHQTQELLVDDQDCDSDVQFEDSGEKPYQCECGKSFILWFSLMVHRRVHCKAKMQSLSAPGQDTSGVWADKPSGDTD